MLMADDKKKLSTLIISKMGKNAPMEASPLKDGAEQDDSMPLESAADELLQAIEQKSAKGVVEALKSLFQMLDDQEDDQSEGSEAPEQEKP